MGGMALGVIGDHRSLVNDNSIVRPDLVVNHVLLVRRNRDIKKRVDGISLQIRIEFFPVVGSQKTQGFALGAPNRYESYIGAKKNEQQWKK